MSLIQENSLVLPIIQLSITPVILISGLGGLMLSLTNRLGRIVDRTRVLAGLVKQAPSADERRHHENQLHIMFKRAKLLRLAVTLAGMSMLVSGLLIIMIFVSALAGVQVAGELVACFVLAVMLLVAALVVFIRDVFVSLKALGIEVERVLATPRKE